METLSKLDKVISEQYTIKISSEVTVHVDDYELGEGEFRNSWDNLTKTTIVDRENLSTELMAALEKYYKDELDIEFDEDSLKDALSGFQEETYFWASKFVDVDNEEPNEDQIEAWKNGEEELFVQDICITVEINGAAINGELLEEILFQTEEA